MNVENYKLPQFIPAKPYDTLTPIQAMSGGYDAIIVASYDDNEHVQIVETLSKVITTDRYRPHQPYVDPKTQTDIILCYTSQRPQQTIDNTYAINWIIMEEKYYRMIYDAYPTEWKQQWEVHKDGLPPLAEHVMAYALYVTDNYPEIEHIMQKLLIARTRIINYKEIR